MAWQDCYCFDKALELLEETLSAELQQKSQKQLFGLLNFPVGDLPSEQQAKLPGSLALTYPYMLLTHPELAGLTRDAAQRAVRVFRFPKDQQRHWMTLAEIELRCRRLDEAHRHFCAGLGYAPAIFCRRWKRAPPLSTDPSPFALQMACVRKAARKRYWPGKSLIWSAAGFTRYLADPISLILPSAGSDSDPGADRSEISLGYNLPLQMRTKEEDTTMNRKSELPKPVLQGGQMPEIMRAIVPDYPKWNHLFFRLNCAFAIINLLLTGTFFAVFKWEDLLDSSVRTYVFLHIVLPTVLNGLILLAAAALRKRLPEPDMRQNVIPVFAMLLQNLAVSMIPHIFFITLGIFSIPICMTTVYSNRKLCRVVTGGSLAGVLLVSVRQFFGAATADDRLLIFPQALIAVCILLTLGVVAQTAVRMTEGQKQKLIRFATDIKKEQRRAEEASEAKSIFLANMSHEIRTPINAILGMNEMILRETSSEQIREYAQSIHSAGSSLLYLVNDVLDISKIESGKLEIAENIYDLSSFIHDCYIMVAEKAEKKGLELMVSCDPQLPSRLKGDESRLRQVVTNLLSNAAKYTEKGHITLSFERREQDGQMLLVVTVKDTGIGIRKEDMDKLFTQFARFDLEKNRNIEGTGLGLALARRLADLMHGTLELQSVYGVGTSAALTVPQQVVDPDPIGDFQQKYLSAVDQSGTYRQSFEAPDARILVVDDVSVNLKVIVNLLKSTQIQVDTAISGKRCLGMVQKIAYDLIFMDHMMPEMDGVETYAKMRALEHSLNRDTPVIMLTANAVSGAREQFLEAGFVDYLSKPVSGDSLESMILKYLPKEKCRMGAAAADAPKETARPKPLAELIRLYPKAEPAKGLEACAGDQEAYFDLLKTYAENPEADRLDTYLEQKKAHDYRVCVHGLKSASLSVGFSALGGQALALENAAREEDWDFIRANHAAFLDEYRLAVGAIQKAFRGNV